MGAAGQCCRPRSQNGQGRARLGALGQQSHQETDTQMAALLERRGRNPPHGSHYHPYLVKKLSSWMCLILITPYRPGPLQTGQTDRRGLSCPEYLRRQPPGGAGGDRPPLRS